MNDAEKNQQLKQALLVAADALSIANNCNVNQVQVNPPKEWDLDGGEEDPEEGWCSTNSLVSKLRQLAN